MKHLFLFVLLFCQMILSQTNVVTFRPDGGSTFGLSDWNTIIRSSNTEFVTTGNFSGIHMTSGANRSAYFGVKGTPRMFSYGERIAVTWLNNSDTPISMWDASPLISFADTNEVTIAPQGQWYAYKGWSEGSEIGPHKTRVLYHDIRIAKNRLGSLTPLSAGIHSSITVCPGTTLTSLVCMKIDIVSADTTPPPPPTNLSATIVTPTKIMLKWRSHAVGSELKRNNVYLNGKRYMTTTLDSQIIAYLNPSKTFTLSVNSEDTIGNISTNNPTVTCATPAYNFRSDLINPLKILSTWGHLDFHRYHQEHLQFGILPARDWRLNLVVTQSMPMVDRIVVCLHSVMFTKEWSVKLVYLFQ